MAMGVGVASLKCSQWTAYSLHPRPFNRFPSMAMGVGVASLQSWTTPKIVYVGRI